MRCEFDRTDILGGVKVEEHTGHIFREEGRRRVLTLQSQLTILALWPARCGKASAWQWPTAPVIVASRKGAQPAIFYIDFIFSFILFFYPLLPG